MNYSLYFYFASLFYHCVSWCSNFVHNLFKTSCNLFQGMSSYQDVVLGSQTSTGSDSLPDLEMELPDDEEEGCISSFK